MQVWAILGYLDVGTNLLDFFVPLIFAISQLAINKLKSHQTAVDDD